MFVFGPAVAALVNRTQLPEVTVAIDGSVYENHPKFHTSMMEILKNFCPKSKARYKNMLAEKSAFSFNTEIVFAR